ncbi:hypothetical protein ACQJBY_035929 [Aegilops geniculata]
MGSANIIILLVLLFSSVLTLLLPTAAYARHGEFLSNLYRSCVLVCVVTYPESHWHAAPAAAVLNAKDGLNDTGGLHHVVVSDAGKAGPVTSDSGGFWPGTAEACVASRHRGDTATVMQDMLGMDYSPAVRKPPRRAGPPAPRSLK